jgi:hypothetical protein
VLSRYYANIICSDVVCVCVCSNDSKYIVSVSILRFLNFHIRSNMSVHNHYQCLSSPVSNNIIKRRLNFPSTNIYTARNTPNSILRQGRRTACQWLKIWQLNVCSWRKFVQCAYCSIKQISPYYIFYLKPNETCCLYTQRTATVQQELPVNISKCYILPHRKDAAPVL